MGRNGLNCFVCVEMELWGFKASILYLISILGASWFFLDQIFSAIDGYRRRSGGGDVERIGTELEGLWMSFQS
ncbi:hypothetical protein Tco_1488696 [Tanacetum coccineum]